MTIQLLQGDVLGAATDGLILTIDGARRGLEGNIARAFARRWPDDFAAIEEQIRYPVPLGRTVVTRPDLDCPFKAVYIASTLHHLEVLTGEQKAGIVASALSEAVQMALRHRMRSLAKRGDDRRLAAAIRRRAWRHARLSRRSRAAGCPLDLRHLGTQRARAKRRDPPREIQGIDPGELTRLNAQA